MSMATGKTNESSTPEVRKRYTRPLSVVYAAVAALLVWVVAVPVLGVDLRAMMGAAPQVIEPGLVIGFALLMGMLGWGLLVVLQRVSTRGTTIWTVIASVFFVLSLAGPLGAVNGAAIITLACMHVVVAATLIGLLPRR
ncbi:DUF6069 family protein [Spongiactinospora sp. TRM90649]|uniref:DUF6069 family protein n=1 Tax=Spongiactinospora sp. TRM90649 TaxID=3031114 RepID=UPI0023FA3FC8|nr:DUF6069 family protein [Spongiactinospora sp. TRM90649]MDF5755596.1 DUF6069 family protein [Spongiactinospora sp. TRM90649]